MSLISTHNSRPLSKPRGNALQKAQAAKQSVKKVMDQLQLGNTPGDTVAINQHVPNSNKLLTGKAELQQGKLKSMVVQERTYPAGFHSSAPAGGARLKGEEFHYKEKSDGTKLYAAPWKSVTFENTPKSAAAAGGPPVPTKDPGYVFVRENTDGSMYIQDSAGLSKNGDEFRAFELRTDPGSVGRNAAGAASGSSFSLSSQPQYLVP